MENWLHDCNVEVIVDVNRPVVEELLAIWIFLRSISDLVVSLESAWRWSGVQPISFASSFPVIFFMRPRPE